MIHEPECFSHEFGSGYCTCEKARAAYKRGREDAADIVNVSIGDNGPMFNHDMNVIAWWDRTVAAARGDGA